jgi:GT2 family glycosyltransferase
MKIGYVCTNYKNTTDTQEAVSSLWRNGGHEFRVVVVDNNSDNENAEALKKLAREFEHVELILNRENVGYFRGLNLGIRHLRCSQTHGYREQRLGVPSGFWRVHPQELVPI